MNNVFISHKSDHWATPSDLYEYFINTLNCYDPCPIFTDYNKPFNYVISNKNVFINPPFSNKESWVTYALSLVYEYDHNVYFLLPLKCNNAFDTLFSFCDRMYIFRHRLKFNDSCSAPFDCCLFVLNQSINKNVKIINNFNEIK